MNLPAQISTALTLDASVRLLTPQIYESEVQSLAATIDVRSPLAVAGFGQ
ncbi:MAG: hypothetical protein JWN66_2454, partial [Sphingomonas bacterium]|nr:hypothetical protein [Sphingomonas bacterium]